ncbi:unnamed protein product [Ectocarpus sp. CCAP 1310/34]|nr:unnamed protein product [Ectocarpus sp. CCAP 1310/34]
MSSSSAAASRAAAVAVALLSVGGFLAQLPVSDGHAYMMTPISRQLGGTTPFNQEGEVPVNFCPHCYQSRGPAAIRERSGDKPWPHYKGARAANGNYLESDEVAQRHGICGDPEQTAAEGDNKYGRENYNYPVLGTYAEGGVLEVKIVVSTYHWGHVEVFLCDTADLPEGEDSIVTQSCFNDYPLDRAVDDEFNGPIDPNYTGRFILDPPCRASETDQDLLEGAYPGDVATARYQLPEGVVCDHCVVQMVYYTGNSCKHEGYADFNPESWPSSCAPSKADWINEVVGQCGDGDAYPEEFWNCADISITSDGGPGTAPRTAPSPTPEQEEYDDGSTPAPSMKYEEDYDEPTPSPTMKYEEEYDEPTTPAPAPVEGGDDDSSSMDGGDYDEPTPAPTAELEPATPMDSPTEPIVATFAPSVPPPVSDHSDCEDPVGAFNQCGGEGYDGSTCCRAGYECEEMAECYSECRPREDRCSEGWGQCGGLHWEGPECCWPGAECIERNEWYHQCVPEGAVN